MREKGFAQITILIVLVIVVVMASAASYYILKSAGKAPTQGFPVATSTPPAPSGEVSDSDEASVIESELSSTTLDSIDTDIKNLETSASSL